MVEVEHKSAACCRACGAELQHLFLDLGMSPLCQSIVREEALNAVEHFYPLRVFACDQCFLVQIEEFVTPDGIFSEEYGYFSSYSTSWVEHARKYVEMAIRRFSLGGESQVVELASNDGYLLQHFVANQIPCLGIEPAGNVAQAALEKGVPTISKFFGLQTAKEVRRDKGGADLIIGNNVLAHVPNLNDFVSGMKELLNPVGTITMEFPHLERLIDENQFDTIYHEHFSYFTLTVAADVFARHGLTVFDVEELETHGGSLRIYAMHAEAAPSPSQRFKTTTDREEKRGFLSTDFYDAFGAKVEATKRDILGFLIEQKNAGRSIVGYGAPGKGNTLLNYCGIRTDILDYTVDRNPSKQNTYTPGTHIPILDPAVLRETKPDFVFILPWNLRDEITNEHSYVREWGGRFVTPIPHIEVDQ